MPNSKSVLNQWSRNAVGLKIGRSRFPMAVEHKTTFNAGYWFPTCCVETLPGDTFEVSLRELVRMLTPAVPVMDNLFLDFAAFFVPNRLCTKGEHDWQKICGSDQPEAWQSDYTQSTLLSTGNTIQFDYVDPMSLPNYLGLPIN